MMFRKSAEAKAAGWFSRRHETRDAHEAAVARYRMKRGRPRRGLASRKPRGYRRKP